MPSWLAEEEARRMGATAVAGVDEAGRGPLAGPVVAAAVVLPEGYSNLSLDDSKKLTAKQRNLLYDEIREVARVGVGQAEPGEIDALNILNATFLAMRRAIEAVGFVDYVLVDGNLPIKDLVLPQKNIVKGDAVSFSIAAASVIAKVTRDRLMDQLAKMYPYYGWQRNRGYATKEHIAALKEYGPSPVHRFSFEPIASMIGSEPYCAG